MNRKTKYGLIIHSRSATKPENLAKIGPVDFETTGVIGIGKNKKQQQIIQLALLLTC